MQDLVKLIQKNYKKITNNHVSIYRINKFYIPLIRYIAESNKKKFLISGSQGIGKSTFLKIATIILKKHYKKNVLNLSLDDFYYDIEERKKLSENVHPLLKIRGVPGTHDINKLNGILKQFEKSIYPIEIPLFDKLTDKKKKMKKKFNKKCDIIILEGWCLGCNKIKNSYLFKNTNTLEKKFDKNFIWRIYYNNQLKKNYNQLFKKFDSLIFYKAPSFSNIYNWRLKQENNLIKFNKKNKKLKMRPNEVRNFIMFYEKITKWMLKEVPKYADIVVYVNKDQKISKIKKITSD